MLALVSVVDVIAYVVIVVEKFELVEDSQRVTVPPLMEVTILVAGEDPEQIVEPPVTAPNVGNVLTVIITDAL
jgi:hypothetical protein